MRRPFLAAAAAVTFAASVACTGMGGNDPSVDAEVEAALDKLEATALVADAHGTAQVFDLKGGGAPTMTSGSGVQVVHVAPLGDGRKSLQAAVVFDRPMVPLSDLDSMSDVPLDCQPPIEHRARWAGTTTAVWIPKDGSFPLAHSFTCAVPAGTPAVDGVTLENRIEWTFETARPKVSRTTPRDGQSGIDPDAPIDLSFSQPVTVEAVAPHLTLSVDGGKKLAVELTAKSDTQLELRADLERDTAYRLQIDAGIVGTNGPLPSTEAYSARFETYPPLKITSFEPSGAVDPWVSLEARFTTPVSGENVAKVLTVSPEPEGWSPGTGSWASEYWSQWHGFAPRTEYTVTLGADLTDQYGQTLGAPSTIAFKTGDYNPNIDVVTGFQVYPAHNPTELPLKHLNCDEVFVELAPVSLEDTLRAWTGKTDDIVKRAISGGNSKKFAVDTSDEPNTWELDAVDMKPFMETGLVAIDTWSPQLVQSWNNEIVHRRALLVVTSLGVTVKVGPHGTEAWVTSLETGKPVAGAEVDLYINGKTLGTAKTDASGLAHIDKAPDYGWKRWRTPLVALARKGKDRGVTLHNWSDGIDPWRFGLYANWDDDGKDAAQWGYTDRGIYKPGDPVYAMAHFRMEHKDGMSAPEDQEVSWTLKSPQGSEVASGKVPLKDGNASVQTELPKDGALGDYRLRIEAELGRELERTVYLSVPARAYREPAFRVSVHADESAISGAEVTGHLDARYMFGAPLTGGDVTWRAWTEPASFQAEGFDGYWFGPERTWWWEDEEQDDALGTLATHETTVAEGGTWALTAPAELDRPVSLNLEAAVTDVDRQQIAGSARLRVHPTSAYVGIRPAERLPVAGEETSFEILALTPKSERAKGAPTTIEVIKRTYKTVREKGVDGRWESVSQREEEVVHSEERSVGGNVQTVRWTPDAPGTFVIRAVRNEADGRRQIAEDRLYVRGSGYASWGLDEDQMLRLVPDKQIYHLGDTAKILVQSPVPGLEALVTVEREGVLWSKVMTLEGTATALELPIEDHWLPNVYVSVVAVEGAPPQDSPDAGRPQVRVGMVDLAIDHEDARVKVAIETDRDTYGPREQVTVDLALTHGDGSPAADMGVVLYAVDEAVLSLTAYKTPDPIAGLIGHRNLSAFTGDSRTALMDRARYLTKGADDGGGGGGESGPEIRENFVTTITWQPELSTDGSGKVRATFELPDNLTAFRIMAVGTSGDRFGSGEREITVTRPLIVRPALPRKLRADDVAFAGVVVHNNEDDDAMVQVHGEVTGPIELLGSPVLVKVPAHGALEVPFRLKATGVGPAEFVFEVKGGGNTDALRWPLIVEEDVPLEVAATSGTTEDSMTERIGKPRTNREDLGGLTIDIGTSALAGAGSGLDYLLEYPHGCLEQTTSRGLGALVALRVREHAGLELDEAELKVVVDTALTRIKRFEATGGRGLTYWPGHRRASPIGTAYAVEFMGRAKQAGFVVDDRLMADSSAYLRDILAGKKLDDWEVLDSLQIRAIVAVALARAGHGDAGHNSNLYSQRNNLSIASTANLLEAIARTTGADGRTATLAQTLESRAFIDAASASIKENESGRWARLWGSDDLSTAAALEALMVADGEHVLAPKFALHLASSKTSGRWANTRATAGVLAALAAYADHYEAGDGERTAIVSLAGSQLLKETLAIPKAMSTTVALADLQEGDLVVKAEGGRVYYEYRLAYAPVEMRARDEGFTVIREVEIVDGGGPDGQVTAGAMLAVTLRVVTPVVRHDVAVIDPIPAGWEPLDSSLATTSRAPDQQPNTSGDDEGGTDELPAFGGSWVYDHHEIDDLEVRLYADYMPPGIHTFRYAARATSPGTYGHPPARAEMMYQPEVFGRTNGALMTVGRTPALAKVDE